MLDLADELAARVKEKQKQNEEKREKAARGETVEDEGNRIDRERREKQKESKERTKTRDAIRPRRASLPRLTIPLTTSLLSDLEHFTMSDIHLHIASLGWQREMTFGAFMQTFDRARTSASAATRSSSSRGSSGSVGVGAHSALAGHLFALFYYAPEMDLVYKQEAERRLRPTPSTLVDVLEVEVRMRFHERFREE